MKTKTVWYDIDYEDEFYETVNKCLEEGWQLTACTVRTVVDGGGSQYQMLFAELILPDAQEEPEPHHFFRALGRALSMVLPWA